jgi:hypothetical protein
MAEIEHGHDQRLGLERVSSSSQQEKRAYQDEAAFVEIRPAQSMAARTASRKRLLAGPPSIQTAGAMRPPSLLRKARSHRAMRPIGRSLSLDGESNINHKHEAHERDVSNRAALVAPGPDARVRLPSNVDLIGNVWTPLQE